MVFDWVWYKREVFGAQQWFPLGHGKSFVKPQVKQAKWA
jgi:hypothetical protein